MAEAWCFDFNGWLSDLPNGEKEKEIGDERSEIAMKIVQQSTLGSRLLTCHCRGCSRAHQIHSCSHPDICACVCSDTKTSRQSIPVSCRPYLSSGRETNNHILTHFQTKNNLSLPYTVAPVELRKINPA